MQILLSIFLLLSIISRQNTQQKLCPKDNPFYLTDKTCSNFSDICFKSDDECKRLLAACDQCPPSNLTISYLSELIMTSKETSNSTKRIDDKLQRILENKLEVLEKLLPICITILVVLFMVILIMLLENRFKILTKCCGLFINQDKKKNYKFLQSRKQLENIALTRPSNGVVESLQTQINGIKESLQTQLNGNKESLQTQLNGNKESLQTQINGITESFLTQLNGNKVSLETQINGIKESLQTQKNGNKESLQTHINETKESLQTHINETKESLQTHINETKESLQTHIDETKESLQSQINGIIESLQTHINETKDAILKSNSFLENIENRSRKIKFKIIGENEHFELNVHGDESVVFIKELICSEWIKLKDFHYKIMKFKCGENDLNDNAYLLSQIPPGIDIVKCEIDKNREEKDIVVLWIKGIHQRNVFLQVDKNGQINQLKDIITNLINRSNFTIFCKKNGNFLKLEDNETFENYQLKDKDIIQIVYEVQIDLHIQSIFNSNQTLPVKCCNSDKILSIHDKIRNTLLSTDLLLIMDSQYLDENNFIFQYNISPDSQIKYCRFKSAKNYIEILDENFPALAMDTFNNGKIFVKRFVITVENNFKTNKAFIKELSTFDILKSKHEFVQIDEPYKDEEYFYIPMEYMEEGSLKDYLEPRNNDRKYVNENKIINWSKQIVDALDFLHYNNIIHRNLKTSNILLYDGSKKLKLSNFSLSKYLNDVDLKEAVDGFMQTGFQPARHLAPEMKTKKYGNKIDIWSFGIVLLEMNNGMSIFPGLNDTFALVELANAATNEDIKYNLRENTSEKFKNVISRCLEINPSLRSTAEELKKHSFLK